MLFKNPFPALAFAFTVHVLEEVIFGFPTWASSHFGRTTERFFLVSHIPLFLAVFTICFFARRGKIAGFFGIALASLLFVNGMFHLLAAIWFREYSPGLVSGATLFPFCFFAIHRTFPRSMGLSARETSAGTLMGAAVSIAIAISLLLDMPDL